jgi:CRP-like cAMP-binding protein
MKIADLDFVLDRELAAKIIDRSVETLPSKDGLLYRRGDAPDCLYFVQHGDVLITLVAAQREVTFRAGPGSLLGIAAIIGNLPYAMSATASSNARVLRLPADAFTDLLDNEPKMKSAILKILAAEVRAARKALANLASGE